MKSLHGITIAAVVLLIFCGPAAAQDADVAQLEKQLAADPTSFKTKVSLAEAYLRACELEKSLKLWREVLQVAPDHARANHVVGKLSLQLAELDDHLEVLEKLIDKGITSGVSGLLEGAAGRAASDAQKARVLYLQGKLAFRSSELEPDARAHFEAAMKLYPRSVWAGHSGIALARLKFRRSGKAEAVRLLREILANKETTEAVRDEARYHLVQITTAVSGSQEIVSSFRELLDGVRTAKVRRMILWQIAFHSRVAEGEGPSASARAVAAVLSTDPPYDEALEALQKLLGGAQSSQDRQVLETLLGELEKNWPKDPALAREASFVTVEALLSRAVVEDDAAKMRGFVAKAGELLAKLDADRKTYRDHSRLEDLRGRALLVESQKLIALRGPAEGLEALMKAKEHYLARLPADPQPSLARLKRIASLLEHVEEWEMAIGLYRDLARRFGHLPQGRDALWRVAWLHNYKLDDPMAALEAYAEYASRYPAELAYRQLSIGQRLRRLGYANVLDFQKRNGLQPDGIIGPKTRKKIEEIEESFDMIAMRDDRGGWILRGRFVHPAIFGIARRLEKAGR
ncbi:MAG TPA: peptidoglycan-binding protein, partial [Phycisphaerae bacterium]|nr:peptidoglycan-binding protein [Phycisphaerae bacterium]